MPDPNQLDSENLVEIHHARDEWEGAILTGFLHDNGIEATLQTAPRVPPFDMIEKLSGNQRIGGLFVLEHDAARARQLVKEFLEAVTDESILAESAAHKLRVDKETVHRLRGALQEENRTFEFLGWVVVVFLGATALLWAIWPDWLKTPPPASLVRWVMALLFVLCAVFVGNRSSKHMK